MKRLVACLWLLAVAPASLASHVVHYEGVARDGNRVAYVEKHAVVYDDSGRLLEATTQYVSEAGKPIAELKSDFRESLTVPTHTVRDFRSGNVQGLRRSGGKVILFDRDPGKPERTRTLVDSLAEQRILVGCQGLNYYLLDHLDMLKQGQELPLRFLIPGKLDYYDFRMRKSGESKDGIVEFEITVQNWFLHMFAPKLLVRYDRQRSQIVWYKGISNITNDAGANQVVTITYRYGAQ